MVAEDGSTLTYKIFFQHKLSENADLSTILVDGTPIQDFQEDTYQYSLFVAYGQSVPELTPVKQEEEQTITQTRDTILSNKGETMIQVTFNVAAENDEFQSTYSVLITLGLNTDADLTSISLRGVALKGFRSTVTEYQVSFPVGSDSTVFYTTADVTYQLSDPKATATVTMDANKTLCIEVVAQDGTKNPYIISQQILLDENNYLVDILLDDKSLPGFTPEQEFYTYYLELGTTPPVVTAIAQSLDATVSVNMKAAGDTTIIVCTSAAKQVRKYYIYFAFSPINESLSPSSRDVLLKYVPGTTDIVVATIRKNVTFVLYDANGHCQMTYKLPTINTNYVDVELNSDNKEQLFNFDNAMGLQIHLLPNQFYIYSFIGDGKHLIQSGKLLMH